VPIAMVKSKFHKDGKDGKLVRSLGVIIPKAIPPIPQRLGLDIDDEPITQNHGVVTPRSDEGRARADESPAKVLRSANGRARRSPDIASDASRGSNRTCG